MDFSTKLLRSKINKVFWLEPDKADFIRNQIWLIKTSWLPQMSGYGGVWTKHEYPLPHFYILASEIYLIFEVRNFP
jgi:hypothetical protein